MSSKVTIIAEISANHGNDIGIVKKTILAAKEAGADLVKIQTYKPESLCFNTDHDYFTINDEKSLWNGAKLHDLYSEGSLPYEWHKELFNYADLVGIELFSTPFDLEGVDFLEELKVKRYKVASFEINDTILLEKIAKTRKPVIISTGIATYDDIVRALEIFKRHNVKDITLLKCTSEYPAKIEDANLKMMIDLKEKFNVKVGLSDHSEGSFLPIVAIAMGAEIIEKHFIIDRSIGGPDASFSLDLEQFRELVENVRKTEKTFGEVNYDAIVGKNSRELRRSMFFNADYEIGTIITEDMMRSLRPCVGIEPFEVDQIIGKKLVKNVAKGDAVFLECVQ